jgi:hypothetical protein
MIFFAIVVRMGVNDTNKHSNACFFPLLFFEKSYDATHFTTWAPRALHSTGRGSHEA